MLHVKHFASCQFSAIIYTPNHIFSTSLNGESVSFSYHKNLILSYSTKKRASHLLIRRSVNHYFTLDPFGRSASTVATESKSPCEPAKIIP